MSFIFGGKKAAPQQQQQPAYTALPTQTSSYGKSIPIIFGRTRVAANLLWYDGFAAVPHVTVTNTSSGGGKGGSSTTSTSSTTYTYTTNVIFGLGEGVISGVTRTWKGTNQTTPSADNMVFFPGNVGQTTWSFLTNNYPTAAFPYSGIAYMAVAALDLGSSANLENYNFEVNGLHYGTAANGIDTKPSDVITELLTNANYGLPFPAASIGTIVTTTEFLSVGTAPFHITVTQAASFVKPLDVVIGGIALTCVAGAPGQNQYAVSGGTYRFNILQSNDTVAITYAYLTNWDSYTAYCEASGLWISPAYQESSPANTLLSDIAKFTNSEFVWTGGVLHLVPRGTLLLSNNGSTYNAPTAPLFDLNDDDFFQVAGGSASGSSNDPVVIHRTRTADQDNLVKIEFLDRSRDYAAGVVEANDEALAVNVGKRFSGTKTAHMFAEINAAITSAQLLLQKEYIRNTYYFTLDQRWIILDPMDIVTLTDSKLGLDRQWVRIIEITENDDGKLDFVAEEYLAGTGAAALYDINQGTGHIPNFNVSPGSINPPIIFEAPVELASTQLEIWCAVSGSDPMWGGCDIFISSDGNSYSFVGTQIGAARMGLTTANFPANLDPDVTNILSVDLTESRQSLSSGTRFDAQQGNTLCWVDGELISYETAVLTEQYHYNLETYIRRGLGGTTISNHLTGSQFARIDDNLIAKVPYAANQIGKTVFIKFVSFNIFSSGEENLADVPAYSHTIKGPPLPGLVQDFQVTQVIGNTSVIFTWTDLQDFALKGYDILFGPVGGTVDTASELTIASRTTEMTNASVPSGKWNFYIRGHDIVDQLGPATQFQFTVVDLNGSLLQDIAAPDWLNATAGSSGFNQGFLTSGTSFTVPNNVTSIMVECIGSGGQGSIGTQGAMGSGGGGGAYATKNKLTVVAGAAIPIQIGVGLQTFFQAANVVSADFGKSGASGGLGGIAINSVGDVVFAGGNGASASSGASGGSALTASGPVVVTANNQVVSNLRITATGIDDGVQCNGFSGVTISNCLIFHEEGRGIKFANSDNIVIQNNNIIKTNSPAKGQNLTSDADNIYGLNANNPMIGGATPSLGNRVENGSTGVYLQTCGTPHVLWLEGHNMRGPLPRGQLVQFNGCTGSGEFRHFSVVNDLLICWTEDNVNMFNSAGMAISDGFIDGNNSPSGDGVMIESGSDNCTVDGVDVVNWMNGAFASAGSANATFTNCRLDKWHGDVGRGPPLSNGLPVASINGSTGTSFNSTNIYGSQGGTGGQIGFDLSTFTIFAPVGPQAFVAKNPLSLSVPSAGIGQGGGGGGAAGKFGPGGNASGGSGGNADAGHGGTGGLAINPNLLVISNQFDNLNVWTLSGSGASIGSGPGPVTLKFGSGTNSLMTNPQFSPASNTTYTISVQISGAAAFRFSGFDGNGGLIAPSADMVPTGNRMSWSVTTGTLGTGVKSFGIINNLAGTVGSYTISYFKVEIGPAMTWLANPGAAGVEYGGTGSGGGSGAGGLAGTPGAYGGGSGGIAQPGVSFNPASFGGNVLTASNLLSDIAWSLFPSTTLVGSTLNFVTSATTAFTVGCSFSEFVSGTSFAMTFVGGTIHSDFYYDAVTWGTLSATAVTNANAIIGNIEAVYTTFSSWFGATPSTANMPSITPQDPTGTKFNFLLFKSIGGTNFGYHCPSGSFGDLYVGDDPNLTTIGQYSSAVGLFLECFELNYNTTHATNPWNPFNAIGEALSRVGTEENLLANTAIYYLDPQTWLNGNDSNQSNVNRFDYSNTTFANGTDGPDWVWGIGFGVLLIYWLRYKKGFTYPQIVQAGDTTWARTCANLGANSGDFLIDVQASFPSGTPVNFVSTFPSHPDNPWLGTAPSTSFATFVPACGTGTVTFGNTYTETFIGGSQHVNVYYDAPSFAVNLGFGTATGTVIFEGNGIVNNIESAWATMVTWFGGQPSSANTATATPQDPSGKKFNVIIFNATDFGGFHCPTGNYADIFVSNAPQAQSYADYLYAVSEILECFELNYNSLHATNPWNPNNAIGETLSRFAGIELNLVGSLITLLHGQTWLNTIDTTSGSVNRFDYANTTFGNGTDVPSYQWAFGYGMLMLYWLRDIKGNTVHNIVQNGGLTWHDTCVNLGTTTTAFLTDIQARFPSGTQVDFRFQFPTHPDNPWIPDANPNLITNDSSLNATNWPPFGAGALPSVSVTRVPSPDGGKSAQQVDFPANRAGFQQIFSPALAAGTYTASIYMRVPSVVSGQQLVLAYYHGDFPTGQTSSTFTPTTTWTRYGPFTFTVAAGDAAPSLLVENIGGANPAIAAETLYLWGVKLETGSTMTKFTNGGIA